MRALAATVCCIVASLLFCLKPIVAVGRDGISESSSRPDLQTLETRAQNGEAQAQYALGKAYFLGQGVVKDDAKGLAWSRLAADQGLAAAQTAVGVAYARGAGVPKDYVVAVAWWRKAADQGNAAAAADLGLAYSRGLGVPTDDTAAVAWWRKGADSGDAKAQVYLARALFRGKGVQVDKEQAVAWWRKAAAKGNPKAETDLGAAYMLGEGVPKDTAMAISLWETAAEHGSKKAEENLKKVAAGSAETQRSRRTTTADPRVQDIPHTASRVRSQTFRSSDCESGHWVESVTSDGEIVKLEDGSVWQIESSDAIDTALWLPTTDIVACEDMLINTEDNEKAEATRIR